ncbi:MmcB family DNA repair protein [Novosphingobium sp.]|uniref:MmcB family DNA repair protein n=1 Tax=Novosphingobium sp. TaxID=1874826 RepID=UPI00333E2CC6
MRDSSPDIIASPLAPTDPQIREALAVARGIARLFARNDIWCLPEMPLRNGRRADLMGIDAHGRVIIVEIKVARADLLGDAKWPDYLDHCDRFFWGLAALLDRAVMDGEAFRPDLCGLIVADGYDAEILRPAPLLPLAPARRKVEVERLARAALRRSVVAADPACAPRGDM